MTSALRVTTVFYGSGTDAGWVRRYDAAIPAIPPIRGRMTRGWLCGFAVRPPSEPGRFNAPVVSFSSPAAAAGKVHQSSPELRGLHGRLCRRRRQRFTQVGLCHFNNVLCTPSKVICQKVKEKLCRAWNIMTIEWEVDKAQVHNSPRASFYGKPTEHLFSILPLLLIASIYICTSRMSLFSKMFSSARFHYGTLVEQLHVAGESKLYTGWHTVCVQLVAHTVVCTSVHRCHAEVDGSWWNFFLP